MATNPQTTTIICNRRGPRALVLPKARLEILTGSQAGLEKTVDRPLFSLGSDEGNDLVVTDPLTSSHHCEIETNAHGYLLRDLDSEHGTYVRGFRIREAFLAPGADVRIGTVCLQFNPLPEQRQYDLSRARCFGDLKGESVVLRRIFRVLENYAATDTAILITGETGVGKSTLAKAIHRRSKRRRKPFLSVDCGALTSRLAAAVFQPHAENVFDGPPAGLTDAFEQANGGTILLRKIGALSPELQSMLMQILNDRQVRRPNTNVFQNINVRVLASSVNRLESAVNKGEFRNDLFARLASLKIHIPPLRERREDLPLLLAGMIAARGREVDHQGLQKRLASTGVEEYLARYSWPGNVRELHDFVQTLSRADHPSTTNANLPDSGRQPSCNPSANRQTAYNMPFKQAKTGLINDFEMQYITCLLDRHDWNISGAARTAQIERAYLQRLTRKYGLNRPTVRKPTVKAVQQKGVS